MEMSKEKQQWEKLLEVYELEDILEMNDIESWEILDILFEEGYIQLPPEPTG